MKIETHLHTKEGSTDSMVSSRETIKRLREDNYEGMIVTDHNSYKGYNSINKEDHEGFTIIKGVEYDTSDAGHMLIILPSEVETNIFTHKGMKLKDTMKIVHSLGGIIGPAHPFDYYRLGMLNNAKWFRSLSMFKKFDFIEGFNACGSRLGNHKSAVLAQIFNKPMFGGSDSHRKESVGSAHTVLPEQVSNENELIALVKSMKFGDTKISGKMFEGTSKDKLGSLYVVGVKVFYAFGLASGFYTKRKALKEATAMSLL